MLAHGVLPEKLIMLLSNPRIRKAGRQVSTDLKLLHDCLRNEVPPFEGSLDLASYAKERHVVKTARASLSDLCAVVLEKCLAKNVSERISGAWEQDALTMEQIRYAACDAYVCLLIYERLSTIHVPQPLLPTTPPYTPCVLYSADNTTIIACGSLPISQPVAFDNINITPTRVVLVISEVLVPGAKVTTHGKRELQTFGTPSFQVVCLRSHVRTYDPVAATLQSNFSPLDGSDQALLTMNVDSNMSGESSHTVREDLDTAVSEGDTEGIGQLMSSADEVGTEGPETIQSRQLEVDQESEAIGRKVLDEGRSKDSDWEKTLRSCVLKDPFHLFNMMRLPASHGLRKEFARVLRDALFVPDNEDRARIAAWAAKCEPPTTFEELRATKPTWLWKHCKRVIPPSQIIYPLVERAFLIYGPLKDATTRQPLFNKQHWHTTKQILDLIRQGFVSDPPGIPLYTTIGIDAKAANLPIYRCFRGTNFTEGGVHTHLRNRLPTSGVSIRHITACLLDFVLGHNLRVSESMEFSHNC